MCLHLAIGFCCPRHQYHVGLIMLAHHNLVNIPSEEAQEKVDRIVGVSGIVAAVFVAVQVIFVHRFMG